MDYEGSTDLNHLTSEQSHCDCIDGSGDQTDDSCHTAGFAGGKPPVDRWSSREGVHFSPEPPPLVRQGHRQQVDPAPGWESQAPGWESPAPGWEADRESSDRSDTFLIKTRKEG